MNQFHRSGQRDPLFGFRAAQSAGEESEGGPESFSSSGQHVFPNGRKEIGPGVGSLASEDLFNMGEIFMYRFEYGFYVHGNCLRPPLLVRPERWAGDAAQGSWDDAHGLPSSHSWGIVPAPQFAIVCFPIHLVVFE